MKYLALLLLSLSSFPALAGPYAYECEITGEYIINDDGKLEPEEKIYIGKSFNVERASGVVLGGGLGNSAYPNKSVIDIGGVEQAYKLLWTSKDVAGTGGGKNAVYLSVMEYEDGLVKPFTAIVGSRVLSGKCR